MLNTRMLHLEGNRINRISEITITLFIKVTKLLL